MKPKVRAVLLLIVLLRCCCLIHLQPQAITQFLKITYVFLETVHFILLIIASQVQELFEEPISNRGNWALYHGAKGAFSLVCSAE